MRKYICLVAGILLIPSSSAAFDSFVFGDDAPFLFSTEHQHTAAPKSPLSLNVEEQKAALSIPLYRTKASSYSIIATSHRTELSESLQFSGRNVSLPKEFQSNQVGLAWKSKGNSGNRYGLAAAYGRAGSGFWSGDGRAVVNLNASMEYPLANGNSWVFFLNYSNNRSTLNNIPIPGVGYSINGPSSRLFLGLPFAFFFYRSGLLSLNVFASPFSASADLGLRTWGPLQLYGNAAWLTRSYHNLVPGSEDRLIFISKELGAGLRAFLGRKASLSIGYVRAIDRRFILGKSRTKTSASAVHIQDADGYQAKLRFSF